MIYVPWVMVCASYYVHTLCQPWYDYVRSMISHAFGIITMWALLYITPDSCSFISIWIMPLFNTCIMLKIMWRCHAFVAVQWLQIYDIYCMIFILLWWCLFKECLISWLDLYISYALIKFYNKWMSLRAWTLWLIACLVETVLMVDIG